ncbi:MAG: response regulator transcription factor [Solobacterium sp.]|nr:response regulator transcription factor [Solobacterium sp.]
MTRIVIVDDHESLRDSFRIAFETAGDLSIVAETANANEALDLVRRTRSDLVLMDVCTAEGASGLEATRQIREVYPDLKMIVMSGFDEISYAPRAKEAGADAFVYKSKSMAFFLEIIQKVLAGEQWFPEPRTIPLPKGEAPLTAREMEILRLICQYRTRNEIAKELYIQPDTVKYHVSNMLAKTGCSTTAELAILMISSGWINPRY